MNVTLRDLAEAVERQPDAATVAWRMTRPVIRKGSKGDAVGRAQTNLNLRSYDVGRVDGIFGAKTDRAVR